MKREYQESLYKTAHDLMHCLDMSDLLTYILRHAGQMLHSPHAYLYLIEPGKQTMELKVGTGFYAAHIGHQARRGRALPGQVWQQRQPLFIERMQPAWQEGSFATSLPLKSAAAIPLAVGSQVIGIMGIDYFETYKIFTEEDIALLGHIANIAAIALDNAQLYSAANAELAERQRTELELKQTVSLLEATLDSTADGLLVVDYPSQMACLYNRKFLTLWEIPEGLLQTHRPQDIQEFMLQQLKREDYFRKRSAYLAEHPLESSQELLEFKSGKILSRHSHPRYQDGQVVGRVFSYRDITVHIRARQLIQQNEEKYRMLFKCAKDGMIVLKFDDEGRVTRVIEANHIMCDWLNTTEEKLLALSPERVDAFSREAGTLPQDNGEDWRADHVLYETNFKSPKGITIPLEVNIHRFELNGEIVSLALCRDLTERRRMEREMARLDRLNLVGEMAAGIGHEVRNPMTTVRGFLQMLSLKPEAAAYHSYYKLMIEELDRANHIITEFLSLAKDKVISRSLGNLNSIIAILRPLIEADAMVNDKYVQMELSPVTDLFLDEKEIRQLILNLSRNALEAMKAGGYLILRTYEDDDSIVLAVSDQGRGIPKEIADKIGTPFFTTKEAGTGLGLAVCYSIAARHNAKISFDTSPQGTTFKVKFHREKQR